MKTRTTNGWKWLGALLLIGVLLLGGAGSALASDIRSGDSVLIGSGEVIDDDLVLFGNSIVVNGTVNGDLIAFGSTITLNGTVKGSAVLGGQTLNVNGHVNGTLYSGAGAMTLGSRAVIERNMMFGGYSLETAPESLVARDLSMGGAQAVLSGKVGRDVQFAGQALELNGTFGRNIRVEVAEPNQTPIQMYAGPNMPSQIASGLRVSRNAVIQGQLWYASSVAQADEILATPNGGVVFEAQPIVAQAQPQPTNLVNEWLFARLRDFITVLLVGLVALWLIRPTVKGAAQQAQTKPLAATAWGLLLLVAGYVLAFVLVAVLVAVGIMFGVSTLGGLAFAAFSIGLAGSALFVTLFTAIVVWGTKVIVSLLIGKLVLAQFAKQYAENDIAAFLVGLVLFEIVATIPILGAVVTFVTILLGLGALWYVYYARRTTTKVSMQTHAPMPA